MNDLATLGIAVDSSPAAKAATDLEKLTTAAERAEDAVNDLGDSSSSALKEVGKGAAPLPAALKEVETSAKSAGKAADGMVSPQLINQMNQFEASLRSGAKSTAELEVQRSQLRSLQKAGMVDDADAIRINKQLDKTQQDLAKSAVQQEKALDQLMRAIDPTAAKLAKLDRDTEELGRALDKGAIDAKTYSTAIGKIDESIARLSSANDPINETTGAMNRLGLGSRQAREDVLQLGNAVVAGDWQGAARNIAQLGAEAGAAGGSLVAAVAPAVGLATVIGFLGVAYYDTIKEAREFNAAINTNGNSAGQTIQSLGELSAKAGQLTGNYSGAKEAILALAATANVSAVQLENLGEAAAAIGTITGKSAGEVATALAGIGDNATDAAAKVSDQYGLITSAQYDIIKALDDNGEHQRALDTLSENLNTAAQARLKKYRESLSEIERDWIDIKNATINAYAAVKGELFPNDAKQLELIRRQIDYINDHPVLSGLTSPFSNGLKSRDEVLGEYNAQAAALEKKIAAAKESAAQDAETETAERQLIAVKRELNTELDNASPAAKRAKAIDDLNDKYFKLFETTAKLNKEDEALLTGVSYDGKTFSGGAYDILLKGINDKNKDPKVAVGSVDLSAFNDAENQLKAIVAQYDNSQKQLDALQKAGLVTQADYSAQRSTLIRAEKDEVTAAYEAEISALEAAKSKSSTTGAQRIQLDQKIADARAAMVKAQQGADSQLEVLATNEEGRLKKQKAAVENYIQALQDQLDQTKRQLEVSAAGVGLGDEARRRLQEDIKIQQDYQQKLDKLLAQRNANQIDASVYEQETAAVRDALAQRLQFQRDYYSAVEAEQSNWVNGATSAFQTYLEQARNTAGLVKAAFTSAFTSLEDAFVSFITSGKASFKDFANSVIADLARIVVKQQLIAPLASSLFGSAGASGGNSGSGSDTALGVLDAAGKSISVATSGFGQAVQAGYTAGEGFIGGIQGAFSSGAGYISDSLNAAFASGSQTAAQVIAQSSATNTGYQLGGSLVSGEAGSATYASATSTGISSANVVTAAIAGFIQGYKANGIKGGVAAAGGAVGGMYAGAQVGSYFGPIGTAVGAVIGTVLGATVGSSIFAGQWVTKDQGIQLGVQSGMLESAQFEYQKKKGGLFHSNKKRTQLTAVDPVMQTALDNSYAATLSTVLGLFDSLNVELNDGVLDGLNVATTQISTKGKTSEQIQEELVKWFTDLGGSAIDAVDAALGGLGLAGRSVDSLTTFVNNLMSVNNVLANLNVGIYDISVTGGFMAEKLSAMAGGLDKLTASATTYYDKFFSDTEKADDVLKAVGVQFAAIGVGLPSTRQGYRDLVEAIDITTDAGRTLFTQLTGLAENASAAYDILEQRAKDAQQAAVDAAQKLFSAASTAESALERAINAQKDSINELLTAANTKVSDLTGVSNDLSAALKSLRGDSNGAVQMLRAQALATLQSALAQARSGKSLAGFDGLSDALATISSNNTDLYSSLDDFNRDQGRTANVVAELNQLNGKQLTSAEQTVKALQDQLKALDGQLAFAQAQLDALNGVDNSVMSVTAAINAMNLSVVSALAAITGKASAGTSTNNGTLIDSVYQALLGRNADEAGKAYWQGQLASGAISYDQLAQAIANAAKANGSTIKVPGYATGGNFGGGLRLVGERGPEMEVTGPSRIYNANQTAAMLSGGRGDGATVAELQGLRREMQSNFEYIGKHIKATADNTDDIANGVQIHGTVTTKAVA